MLHCPSHISYVMFVAQCAMYTVNNFLHHSSSVVHVQVCSAQCQPLLHNPNHECTLLSLQYSTRLCTTVSNCILEQTSVVKILHNQQLPNLGATCVYSVLVSCFIMYKKQLQSIQSLLNKFEITYSANCVSLYRVQLQ